MQNEKDSESELENEVVGSTIMSRKAPPKSVVPKLEIPVTVQQVISKIEQAQLLRARQDINMQLGDIMQNVQWAINRYTFDENIHPGRKISLTEHKKRRPYLLEKIAIYANSAEIREKTLVHILAWLEEWNAILSEMTVIDIDEHHHWIARMEILPETFRAIESNVNILSRISAYLLEEKKKESKKTTSRGTLWKSWKERVIKRPATAHALRPDQMISDEFATNTKVSEIQGMLQELVGTAMFNKLENNAIKYISSTIANLSKALSILNDEVKVINLQSANMYMSETNEREKELSLKIIEDLSEKNEILQQKLQDAEEKCEQLIRSKVSTASPTSTLKMLSELSPQSSMPISKADKEDSMDNILTKELETIVDEAQKKGTKDSGIKWDSAVLHTAQVETTPDLTGQESPLPEKKQKTPSEDKILLKKSDVHQKDGTDQYQLQKRKHKKGPHVHETSGSSLDENERKQIVSETKVDYHVEQKKLEKKNKEIKSSSEAKSKSSIESKGQHVLADTNSQGGKSGASSIWEQPRMVKAEYLLKKSQISSEDKKEPTTESTDKESKSERDSQAEPFRLVQLDYSSEKLKARGKKHQSPSETTTNKEELTREDISLFTKKFKSHEHVQSKPRITKETSESTRSLGSSDDKSQQSNLEEFQKAIMAFLKEKTDNISKPLDKKTALKKQLLLKKAEVENLEIIKAKMDEYFQNVTETVTKILRKYKDIKNAQVGEKAMKQKKVVSFMPELNFQEPISAMSEIKTLLSNESMDPAIHNLIEMILTEIESERDAPVVSVAGRDHKEKEKQKQKEYLQEGQEKNFDMNLKHQSQEEKNLQKKRYEIINKNMEKENAWLQMEGKQEQKQNQWQDEKIQKEQQKQGMQKQIEQYEKQKQMEEKEEQQKQKEKQLKAQGQKIKEQERPLEKGQQMRKVHKEVKHLELESSQKKKKKPISNTEDHEGWQKKAKDLMKMKEENSKDLKKIFSHASVTLSPRWKNIWNDVSQLHKRKEFQVNLETKEILSDEKHPIQITPPTSTQSSLPGPFPILEQSPTKSITVIPEKTKALKITPTSEQAQRLARPFTPEQAQALDITLTPHQAQSQGITLTPQQAQAQGITITPEQAKAQGITITPQEAQALGITLTHEQAQARGITLTPEQAQALDIITLTPHQAQSQSITLTPQQTQAQEITITPEWAKAQGITVTPQQAQALGITVTPQQAQALGITLTPDQAQAEEITVTPEQAQAQGITLTPQQAQAQGISLTPEQAQSMGITLTPQQAQAQGISLTPEQAQTREITLTPEQAQARGITLIPRQAQSMGITLTPQQAQAQGISLTSQQAQAQGIALIPEQVQTREITLTPEWAQARGITLTPRHAQSMGITHIHQQAQAQDITLTPQQAQALGITLTSEQAHVQGITEHAQAQRITLTPQQAQALGVTLTTEQAHVQGITVTPEQAQAQGVTHTPQETQTLRISLTPQQAHVPEITVTPEQALAQGITLTAEQFKAFLTPEKSQGMGVILTHEQVQASRASLPLEQNWTLKAPITPNQRQTLKPSDTSEQTWAMQIPITTQKAKIVGVPITQRQDKALGVTITPQQTQALQDLLTDQAQTPAFTLTPEKAQTLGITHNHEQAQAVGITLTPEQKQALAVPLTLDQTQALDTSLTTEQALKLGVSVTPEIVQEVSNTLILNRNQMLGIIPSHEQAQAFGTSFTLNQPQALGVPITPPNIWVSAVTLTPEQTQALGVPLASDKAYSLESLFTPEQVQPLGAPSTPGQAQPMCIIHMSEQDLKSRVPPINEQSSRLWAVPPLGHTLGVGTFSITNKSIKLSAPHIPKQPPIPAPSTLGPFQESKASLPSGQCITSRTRQSLVSSAPMAEKSSILEIFSTPLQISRSPLTEAPFVPGKSLGMGIPSDSRKLLAPQPFPSSSQTRVSKTQSTSVQIRVPEVPPATGKLPISGAPLTLGQPLALDSLNPRQFPISRESLTPQLPLISKALLDPRQPLISAVTPTSSQIPSLWDPLSPRKPLVPGLASIPEELIESGHLTLSEQPQAFQPPATCEQSPYLQAPSTLWQHLVPQTFPKQTSPLWIPSTSGHPPILGAPSAPGKPQKDFLSSVSKRSKERLAIISSLKSKPASVDPSTPNFKIPQASFTTKKFQISEVSDTSGEIQIPCNPFVTLQSRTFQSYLTNDRIPVLQTPYIDEGAVPTLMKPITSLPSLTTKLPKTSQILPSEWDQKSRFPPINKPCILTSVSGTKKPKEAPPSSPQELKEQRYFVDVEAQRRNLILLNQAIKTSGLPSELHETAKNLITEILHTDTVWLGYLFHKYIAYRLIQRARNNIIKRLQAIQYSGKGYETQNLYIMLSRIDDYQKKVMGVWTKKQKSLEQERNKCLKKMIFLFRQLREMHKLNLSQPIPLIINKNQIPAPTKFAQQPLLELLIEEDRKLEKFKKFRQEDHMEAIWNADQSTSSYPIEDKTSINSLWAKLGLGTISKPQSNQQHVDSKKNEAKEPTKKK